jgi:pyruvate ferredoxin oxidoreductase alpha subunit
MKRFLDGNEAAARAALDCQVQVIAAYPITPQTTIVEHLAQFVADGRLKAEIIHVESEHSALSAVVGASMVGARAFTASCSQGLQLMSEVLYFTSGMRQPVVMAVANRTLSQPVNIWVDHQDSMVNRDAGWLQFYAATCQEVYDFIILGYKIGERREISLPCMVCFDGFITSHVAEEVDTLDAAAVGEFLVPLGHPQREILDPERPLQFGEVLFPPWYPGFEYKKHRALLDSIKATEEEFREFKRLSKRGYDLVIPYMVEDAELIFLGLGSHMLTCQYVVDQLRGEGKRVGLLRLLAFRPFPEEKIRAITKKALAIVVLDRSVGYGTSGLVYPDITRTFANQKERPYLLDFIIGLGGKDISPHIIERCYEISLEVLSKGEVKKEVFWPEIEDGV